MNLENIEKDELMRLLDNAVSDENYELECIIGNMNGDYLNKEDFINVLKRFKGKTKYSRMTSKSTLSIYLSNENEYKHLNKKISRIILPGNGLINMYNSTNKLDKILNQIVFERKFYNLSKSTKEKSRIINNQYNIRFNLKLEETINPDSEIISQLLRDWSKIPKYFRRKQTFSFYHDSNDFRIDISIISQNKPNTYVSNLKQSEVLTNKNITYEVEIEYIGNKNVNTKHLFFGDSKSKKLDENVKLYRENVLNNYLDIISTTLQAKQQSLFIITNQERSKVLEKINNLIKNPSDDYFPTVVDLTRSNCIQLPLTNYGNKDYPANIRMDYAVTDKADGLRKLLFIANNGKCYLKSRDRKNDDKFSIKYTGTIIKDYAYSIFDGELIETTMEGKYVQNFYIFDAYIVKGENLIDKPFGESKDKSGRYYQVNEFESFVGKSNNVLQDDTIPSIMRLKIFKKVYYYGDSLSKLNKKIEKINMNKLSSDEQKYDSKILEQAAHILSKTNIKYGGFLEDGHMFSYPLDGLIFQPVRLGVSQNDPNEKVNKIGKTWFSAFRWKPQHELTIDFMVKFNKEPGNVKQNQEFYYKGNKYIRGTLFCKMWKNNTIHKNLMAFKLLNEGINFRALNDDYPFSPIYPFNGIRNSQKNIYDFTSQIFLLVDQKGSIKAQNGDIIYDGTTIECSYDFTKLENMNWIPKRVRQGKIPNSYMTAIGVWKLINNSVTTEMITNNEDIIDEESYYNNQSSDETKAMRSFNNFVKDEIIKRAITRNIDTQEEKTTKTKTKSKSKSKSKSNDYNNPNLEKRVLDLACGRFGDYFKYCKHGATYVVGVDISPDNIYNQNQGAAVRLIESIKQSPTCRDLVNNTMLIYGDCTKNLSSGKAGLDELNKYYLDVLYGRVTPHSTNKKLSKMANLGINGFNVVVCNLAIHYMFNNRNTLDTFFTNVRENIVNGGYFIGTFLDGQEILKKLKNQNKIEGYYDDKNGSKLIWRIENTMERPLFKDSYLGQKITVYMDTFMDSYEENLMSLDFMVEEAKNHNLALVDSKLFIDDHDNLFSQFKKSKSNYYKDINDHPSIKEWIQFHRWFIFKKV